MANLFPSQTHHLFPPLLSTRCDFEAHTRFQAIPEEPFHNSVRSSSIPYTYRFSMQNRVSLFYLVGLFDLWAGIRTIFISSAGAYLIAAYIEGPLMPWIGFIFLMGHMSISHIDRQFLSRPDKIDITGRLGSYDHNSISTYAACRSSDGSCHEAHIILLERL